jgi:hypothetical protein
MKHIMYKCLFLLGLAIAASGCTAKDPSAYDLKSPCVSNGFRENVDGIPHPCERRKPLENYWA